MVLRPRVRYVLAWLLALATASGSLFFAWHNFDVKDEHGNYRRMDRNDGHAQIDFANQWLMGRMLVKGHGQHLYHRGYLREVLREAYPRTDEIPAELRTPAEADVHDSENVIGWMVGRDDPAALASTVTPLAASHPLQAASLAAAGQTSWESRRLERAVDPRGGPLYPPAAAFLYWLLGLAEPQQAYRTVQAVHLLLALAIGLGICLIAQGRIWWPVAVLLILIYPGFRGSINLGQNAAFSLTILTWGWVLIARGKPGWGGLLWALFCFKPVWAAAFFFVLLVTRRWRACAAMLGGGALLGLLTIPFVGWQRWLDWLDVAQTASQMYGTDFNWIVLSRDVLNIPRRWLLELRPDDETRELIGSGLGWGLWLVVVGLTASFAMFRRSQAQACTGPAAAFLLLGAWMSCYHFMYYDVLLTALPVLLLFTEPGQYLQPIVVAVVPARTMEVDRGILAYLDPTLPQENPSRFLPLTAAVRHLIVMNRFAPTIFVFLLAIEHTFPLLDLYVTIHTGPVSPLASMSTAVYTPWDTYCLILLWIWCGWRWRRCQPAAQARDAAKALASASG